MPRIREFQWADYDAVVAVWSAAGRGVVPRDELAAKLTRDPELFLIADADADADRDADRDADADGAVAGVIMGTYDGRRGWLLRLAVHPAHRRKGVATLLVHEVERRLAALGCPRVNLLVMPDNAAGLRFWQALGYLPCPDVLCTKPLPG